MRAEVAPAIPTLAQLLRNPDADVQRHAAGALKNLAVSGALRGPVRDRRMGNTLLQMTAKVPWAHMRLCRCWRWCNLRPLMSPCKQRRR